MAQCTINDSWDCLCEDGSQWDCILLPDIQVSWYGLENVSDGPTEYSQDYNGANAGRLRISVSTPNDGYGPLTVRGVDDNGWAYFICGDDTLIDYNPSSNLSGYYCDDSSEPARQITFQRIYRKNPANDVDGDGLLNDVDNNGTPLASGEDDDVDNDGALNWQDNNGINPPLSYEDVMAGSMTYHPTHGHNHSDDWGVFTLRMIDEDDPNPLNWPIVSDGAKMGFCLMDYGTCGTGTNSTYYGHCRDENRYSPDYLDVFPEFNDGTNGGTVKYNSDFPNFGLGGGNYGCSPIEQGISAGWLDLYGEWLDDQWINIEPGLCNGVYWIVGEVDRNDNYLESNEENNWTAIPVILTEQLDGGGYDISIISNDNLIVCDGEVVTLSPSSFTANEYLWSNGETTPSITVNQSGDYSLLTSGDCGDGQSQVVNVIVNEPVEDPITNNLTIESGESAVLNANGTGNIIWQDANGDFLASGDSYTSGPLFENTNFYVLNEEVLIEAPEELSTGAPEHEGSSAYSSSVYNGGLLFNAASTFTLNSVKVYTDYAGERTIELHDENGDVINELTINIPDNGNNATVIDLNWEITAGYNYILTTNFDMNNQTFGDNNPQLRRTTDDLPNFPYTIENIVEITDGMYDSGDGPGFSTSYYYYFYDWKINNEWGIGGETCLSNPIEVNVMINEGISGCVDSIACNFNSDATIDDGSCVYAIEYYDCDGNCISDNDEDMVCDELDNCPNTYNPNQEDEDDPGGLGDACDGLDITELGNNLFSIFPNPAKDVINIKFNATNNDVNVKLYNNVGKLIDNIVVNNNNQSTVTLNTFDLPAGVYFIHYIEKHTSAKQSFTISK